jgi:hypothetical protein
VFSLGLVAWGALGGCFRSREQAARQDEASTTRASEAPARAAAEVARAPEGPGGEAAELAAYLRERYTKHEHRVRMRDGVALFTVVYTPKDHSRTYPIMLLRTPYGVGPYGVDNYPLANDQRVLSRFAPSAQFIREGYIFAHQDVRGRMMSEGTFVDVRPHLAVKQTPQDIDESSDAYDTIDWLVKNVPGNSGRVGAWGISYPGFYAAQAAIDAHPALRAVSPQAPVTDWFVGDDFHHNGALCLADAFDFFSGFGKPRPAPVARSTWGFDYGGADLYTFFLRLGPLSNVDQRHFKGEIAFWKDLMAHPTRDDFWKARDPLPAYRDIRPATLVVGGWFDAEDLWGTLATYHAIEQQSPRAKNSLVMGPWKHGGWARTDGDSLGNVSFGSKTSLWYRQEVELPFFRRHLKGDGQDPGKDREPPEARVFETGTNEWLSYESWPPREAKKATMWLGPAGTLAPAPPPEDAFDEYLSDPAHPVPFQGKIKVERGPDYMVDDQRFAAARPDVLTYATAPLDGDVALAGPIEASLWVSTTGTDADLVVKLIDVYPDNHADPTPNPQELHLGGYQQLVRAEVMRGRFRESLERPVPFVPGEPSLVKITLPDVAHAFRPGHRIMVQIQSSWFPLFDRNPQQMVDPATATAADFKAATHRVLRGGPRASSLALPVLRGALPAAPPGP